MVKGGELPVGLVAAVVMALLVAGLLGWQSTPSPPTLETLPAQFVWLLVGALLVTWVPYLTRRTPSTTRSRQLLLGRVLCSASLALLFCPPSFLRSVFGAQSSAGVQTALWWAGTCVMACGVFCIVRASLMPEPLRRP